MSKGAGNKEETPIEQLGKLIPKKFNRNGFPIHKQFEDKIKQLIEDGDSLTQLHLWEEANSNQVKLIFECLTQTNINTISSLRFWKIKSEDEGIRALCEYLQNSNLNLTILELIENKIKTLGCQFLGNLYLKNPKSLNIQSLVLDQNNLSDEGIDSLTKGLRKSACLKSLSLNYCNISSKGAQHLQRLLLYVNTSIEILNLQGNYIENEGFYQICRALEVNNILKEIDLTDNQILEEKLMLEQFLQTIAKNPTLYLVNLTHNFFSEDTARDVLSIVKTKMKPKIEFTQRFNSSFAQEFNAIMIKIKPQKESKKKPKK